MTAVQRARLVVAMGLLNLILATVALTAGIVGPNPATGDIARASDGPGVGPTGPGRSPNPSTTEPTLSPGPTPAPSGSVPSPSTEPGGSGAPAGSASPVPSGDPIVAVGPTPTPGTDTSTMPPLARPTQSATPVPAKPTPRATPRPTVRPAPTPAPATGSAKKPRPPCPDHVSGPPGHRKVTPPPARPCGKGDGAVNHGIVVLFPLVVGSAIASAIRRSARSGSPLVRRARRS